MNLPTRTFTDIVRDMSAAITASAGELVDLSIGSILRAIIEANAAIVLWAQWLALLTLQTTRAATSSGADLDSWMADFSLSRLPAIAAAGIATFSRYSSVAVAVVPVGTMVKTQDGSVSFLVAADQTNPAWSTVQSAYSLAVGVNSVDLPIIASLGGSFGNILSNTITLLASSIPGIDFVNNNLPTTGGTDPETDVAFRVRFGNFFAARSRATVDAIGYAISQVGPDLNYAVQENVDAAGNFRVGNILVVVDDGTGSLSLALFSSLSGAIEKVRPVGTTISIQPPSINPVNISMSWVLSPNLIVSTLQSLAQSSIEEYIDALPIGGMLSVTRISQLVYLIDPGIRNISNIGLNGQATDLTASATSSFKFQSLTFI
jgi:uncharacterized phage protein gp47/JayE